MTVLEMIKLIITVIALAILLLAYLTLKEPITKFLASKMSKENYENLINITRTAVRYAEQWLAGVEGHEKKSVVYNYVSEKCKEYNLGVDSSDIDKAIESAVKELNNL